MIPTSMRLRMEVLVHTCRNKGRVWVKVKSDPVWSEETSVKLPPQEPKLVWPPLHRFASVPPRNCTFPHFQTNCRCRLVRPSVKAESWIFPDICELFITMVLISAKLASFFPVLIYETFLILTQTWFDWSMWPFSNEPSFFQIFFQNGNNPKTRSKMLETHLSEKCTQFYAISAMIILPNVSPSGCMQFCQRSTGQKDTQLDEGLFYWVYGQLDGDFMLLRLWKKAEFCPFYFFVNFPDYP